MAAGSYTVTVRTHVRRWMAPIVLAFMRLRWRRGLQWALNHTCLLRIGTGPWEPVRMPLEKWLDTAGNP